MIKVQSFSKVSIGSLTYSLSSTSISTHLLRYVALIAINVGVGSATYKPSTATSHSQHSSSVINAKKLISFNFRKEEI